MKISLKNKYRSEIDGLRALAVLAVIINHFDKSIIPSGYLGVDIFFVISGFVITSSLDKRKSNNFKEFILSFYERRIKRLIPALIFFILPISIIFIFLNPLDNAVQLRTGILSIFGLSNLYLIRQSTDYFAESTELNPFAHTWSLGVEEQFYIIFPLIIWFSGFGLSKIKGKKNLISILLLLSTLSFALFISLYNSNLTLAYFLMPTRFWEMASGSILYLIATKTNYKFLSYLGNIPSFLNLICILFILFLPAKFGLYNTILIVIFSNLLIFSIRENTLTYKFLSNKIFLWIGKASYSLYLWHWGILSLNKWSFGISSKNIVILIPLTFLIAFFSYKLIENPLRKLKWFSNNPKIIIFTGFSFSTISALFVLGISILLPSKKLIIYRNNIFPPVFKSSKVIQKNLKCHLPSDINNAFNDCLKIQQSSDIGNIYLIGDSHASNHFPSIKSALGPLESERVSLLVEYGIIRSLMGFDKCEIELLSKSKCIRNSWVKYTSFFNENLKDSDIVLISMSRDRFVNKESNYPRIPNQKYIKKFEEKIINLNKIVNSKNAKIGLIDDIPTVCKKSVNWKVDILLLGNTKQCEVPKRESLKDREVLSNLYRRLDKEYESIEYIDFHNDLCFEDNCGLLDKKGNLIYADPSPHFGEAYPDLLKDEWVRVLKSLRLI